MLRIFEFVIGPPESYYFVSVRVTATQQSKHSCNYVYSLEIALWPYEYVKMEKFRRKMEGEANIYKSALFISSLHRDLVGMYLGREYIPYWDTIKWHVKEEFALY